MTSQPATSQNPPRAAPDWLLDNEGESAPTIYPSMVYTMDDALANANAVAVEGRRIVGVGDVAELLSAHEGATVDDRFADKVMLPGLIDQHLHPLLGASTLATEVIATEDWVMPDITFRSAQSPEEYDQRLVEASERQFDDDWLVSWGYHALWHGPLDRERLDRLIPDRPVGIWQRSCHEWFMNTAAMETLGIDDAWAATKGQLADMIDVAAGHAWENGFFNAVLGKVAPILLSEERLRRGLHQMVSYLHRNGVTAFNEPGLVWAVEPVDLYTEILGADDCPILSTFLVDGRSQAAAGRAAADAPAHADELAERLPTVADAKVAMLRKQVKLFADGAIISQLMVMAEPYLDTNGRPDPDHQGEWLMEPDVLRDYFHAYWNADYQIHTHVNGDGALELLLDIVEECQRKYPRTDHRCVVVHFANSTEAQIQRIARLGLLVSANPYYPVGFADRYGLHGLGPERADNMVRAGSVVKQGIGLSLHSDLPMAPSEPLFLASCAINRITPSGRVAGPDQRIDVHHALRAITIEAAYSWRMEHEIGSIEVGKRATFTVLDADPYGVKPQDIANIGVEGTMFEGRWFPNPGGAVGGARLLAQDEHCGCDVARSLAQAKRTKQDGPDEGASA